MCALFGGSDVVFLKHHGIVLNILLKCGVLLSYIGTYGSEQLINLA